MHSSQAPPSHTNTVGLLRRLGVRVSRLVVDLQAFHRHDAIRSRYVEIRTRHDKDRPDGQTDGQTDRRSSALRLRRSDGLDSSRQIHRQNYFYWYEKTDSSRLHYRPTREGELTDRQDRRCTTMHLDGLSHEVCEMLVGPRRAGSLDLSYHEVGMGWS